MAAPYELKSERMTDGLHAESRMLGDVKFHQHEGVDASVAERWREEYGEESLSNLARGLAARLGYELAPAPRHFVPIERVETAPGTPQPLSFAQERLWFLDQLDPGQATYNISTALHLAGPLDVAALAASLAEIVRRHEVLRSTFPLAGGGPVQVVGPPSTAMAVVDFSAVPAGLREAEVRRRVSEEANRPFDIARGPLLRAVLLRAAPEEHVAVVAMHHIVSDGWSISVLNREVASLYGAFSQGRPSPLPELPIQYADFARWQRGQLRGEVLDEEIAYWRERLAGAPPRIELPTDRPRPAVQRFRGTNLSRPLSAELTRRLTELGRGQGTTLFMGLLAAFEAFLVRHGSGEDVVVGTPVAGRNRREVEDLIGFFLNSLTLRTRLEGDPGFREILARTRETALGAFAHQDLPFEKLVQELAPERNPGQAPLYQVMLVLQNASREVLELTGLTLARVELPGITSKLDLTLNVQQDGEGLVIHWLYNRDLFDAATVARFAGHFERLLAAAVESPETRLWDLPVLTAAEELQLAEWNATVAAYPAEPCLHELIAAQADPELVSAARRLALRLRELGVGSEVPVGVCAERSPEMVVGLLAVLEAGGAYLPLDPDYPQDRLAFMLADSAVPVVLAQERLLDRLPEHGARVVLLDDVAAPGPEVGPIASGVRPENLAYVIYTSGSTGRPKGTMNTHRGIVNRLLWMQEEYGLTAGDRVLQKTPFSFDVSVWEFFWPLLTGARLVMAKPGGHQDPGYLVRTIQEEEITTLHFVPSMLQVFLEAPGVEQCPSLQRVMCSGEALPLELTRRFFARLPQVSLHNLYGPTEAAVDVTYWPCDPQEKRGVVPIGRPVANTEIHLLDPYGNPVPVGVPGELLIGGVQLGRGYLARPDLTAERFVPAEGGARLYRTGDLARYLPDGAIDFLGRIDHQVKVRGLRIELGEIESALARHPAVREAVVLARSGGSGALGGVNLVAYVTPKQVETAPDLAQLRQILSRNLPEYMLPSALVVLDAMPLTASGKVDRKALPEPERSTVSQERVAPRTDLERLLARLWSETLSVEPESIGIHDSFFEIGGNSITGAIFINRLQQELGEIVHVVTIFDSPTIEKLAAFLEAEYGEKGQTGAVQVDAEALQEVRQLIRMLPPLAQAPAEKNPPAV
ncbi:MAG TPA: amino acid adenylation domain-containing protein, partial [Thermoanaerobaculia bacterium]|nr:amino acid adenylation domain-containing protein [Thermoanaerobaculia bacterium]